MSDKTDKSTDADPAIEPDDDIDFGELEASDLENLPEEKRYQIVQQFKAMVSHQHSGPLPSPDAIAEYNRHITNGADRIMKMAEKEQDFRHHIINKTVDEKVKANRLGQLLGFLVAVIALSVSMIVTNQGHAAVGITIGGSTVVSLVAAFIFGKSRESQQDPEEDGEDE